MQLDSSFQFDPIFDSTMLVVAIALVLLALLMLLPTFRAVNTGQQRTLLFLRTAVIVLFLIALLRPARITNHSQPEPGTLIVLLDQSRSMQVSDIADGKSRWDAVRETIARCLPELETLREDFEVKVYAFDHQAELVTWQDGQLELCESPDGDQSDIGSVLSETVRREFGQRVMGVVLLSDGAARVYAPRVELRQAARELARLGCPLFTVTYGQPREGSQARDIAVERFPDHYTVFLKNEIELHGSLRVQGFTNKEIPVELVLTDESGQEKNIATHMIQANEDGQLVDIRFPFLAGEPGRFRLTARAAHQPGELVVQNNELTCYVTVREGGLKVLYLYGNLVGEQRRLRQSIDESADMQLHGVWVDHGRRDHWQINSDLFDRDSDYDVTIFESVHANALNSDYLERLAADIDQGMGFLMIGGSYSFGAGNYQSTPFAQVLPVRMNRFERQDLDGPIVGDLHQPGPLKMFPTIPHFVTRLASSGENRQVWDRLPALDGANRFAIKSRAEVLAESANGDHLLISGNYGSGRVLAFGGDSTWKWWSHGFRDQHKRFWRQAILWLGHREESGRDDVWIRLSGRRHQPASLVEFSVGATNSGSDPIVGASFQATLIHPDGGREALQLSDKKDIYSGRWKAGYQPGQYTIEVIATSGTRELGSAHESFEVFDHDIELQDPAANPTLMASLAEMTLPAGGRNLAPEELPALIRVLGETTMKLEVAVQTTWKFGDTARDTWPFFLVVVSLLTGEWYLRKKWGLV